MFGRNGLKKGMKTQRTLTRDTCWNYLYDLCELLVVAASWATDHGLQGPGAGTGVVMNLHLSAVDRAVELQLLILRDGTLDGLGAW